MSTRTQQQVETVTRFRTSAGPAEDRGSDSRHGYGTGRKERKATSVPLTLGLLFDDASDIDLDFD